MQKRDGASGMINIKRATTLSHKRAIGLVVNGATRNVQLFPTLNLSLIHYRGLLGRPR